MKAPAEEACPSGAGLGRCGTPRASVQEAGWERIWLPRLCAEDSTSGHEDRMLPTLLALLAELGATVVLQEVAPGRTNVLATWGTPRLLLSTHLDTVPPFRPPRTDAQGLRGRGACDAKGQVVAQLAAIRQLLQQGYRGLAWLGVVGEETDAAGARRACELGPQLRELRAVINGEPTEGRLASAQLGYFHLTLTCTGRRGHPAVEGARHNALWSLLRWLDALRSVPLAAAPAFGTESWNLGRVQGGEAANVVAGEARAEIAARTVPGSTFLQTCERLAPAGATVAVRCSEPPLQLATLPGFASAPVAFGSDAPWLAELLDDDGQLFMLGPGSIHCAHTDGEHLTWSDLAAGIDALCALSVRLLAMAGRS